MSKETYCSVKRDLLQRKIHGLEQTPGERETERRINGLERETERKKHGLEQTRGALDDSTTLLLNQAQKVFVLLNPKL